MGGRVAAILCLARKVRGWCFGRSERYRRARCGCGDVWGAGVEWVVMTRASASRAGVLARRVSVAFRYTFGRFLDA